MKTGVNGELLNIDGLSFSYEKDSVVLKDNS